jgi:peptide chain release factor subunit 1
VIDESQLQELAAFQSLGADALSLYLNTDLTQQPKEKCRLVLRDLLQRVSASATAEDVARVERYFDQEYDWRTRGVAIFASAKNSIWRVYPLALPVASEAHTGQKLYLKPLSDLLDEHGRYGVVLVDRESARFFLVYMGKIEEKSASLGEQLKRHRQGGTAPTRFQRRADKQSGQNLRLAAEVTTDFCQENHCERLVLAGSEENVVQFREMLPRAHRKHIVGTLVMDMEATVSEVRDRSTEMIRSRERERKRQLVDDMITAAAKGGGAVIGLADTFHAMHEGRVHTLVVEKAFESEGYLCEGCGHISVEPTTRCASCGGKPQKIGDAVNRTVRSTIQVGGRVETVEDNPALAKAGHVGAILRY